MASCGPADPDQATLASRSGLVVLPWAATVRQFDLFPLDTVAGGRPERRVARVSLTCLLHLRHREAEIRKSDQIDVDRF
jgi:hypothetical protein